VNLATGVAYMDG